METPLRSTAVAKPKYKRVKDAIMKTIRSGNGPGERLPSIRELMSLHGASYATVTRALDELRDVGIVEHRWGKGIFIGASRKGIKNLAISFDSVFKPTDPRIVQILQGIGGELAQTDWHMQLYPLPNRTIFGGADHSLLAALLQEKRIDGLIAISPHPPEDIERLQAMCIPTVSIMNEYPGSGIGCVQPDTTQSAEQIIDYVVKQQDHQRIHLVLGPQYNYSARLVRTSTSLGQKLTYELRRLGLRCPPDAVFFSDYRWETVEPVVRKWLTSDPPPQAIVLADPYLADLTLSVALELGFRVPTDLSIVSWGAGKPSNFHVSGVVLPLEEIGAASVAMLLRIVAGEPATIERLPVKMVHPASLPASPQQESAST